jgi:hypothetical protein
VAVTTVQRAVVQQRATGSLERQPIPGCPRRSGTEQEALLRERLDAAPDATVLEHGAWWAEQQGPPLARGDAVAGDPPPGLDAHTKTLAAVPSVTSRRARPSARRSPRATPRRSSWSTQAAPIRH